MTLRFEQVIFEKDYLKEFPIKIPFHPNPLKLNQKRPISHKTSWNARSFNPFKLKSSIPNSLPSPPQRHRNPLPPSLLKNQSQLPSNPNKARQQTQLGWSGYQVHFIKPNPIDAQATIMFTKPARKNHDATFVSQGERAGEREEHRGDKPRYLGATPPAREM